MVGFLGGPERSSKGFQLLPEIVAAAPDESIRWMVFAPRPEGGPYEQTWQALDEVGAGR